MLSVGTDEHGSKIVRNYHQNSFKYDDIQDFVDHISSFYRNEFSAINIDSNNSVFIRTTDHVHKDNAAEIWSKVESKIEKVQFKATGHVTLSKRVMVPGCHVMKWSDN